VYNAVMAKRGRPRKNEKWRKCERLDLRVDADEKKAFKYAADLANQELSVWIRIHLHKAAGQVPSENVHSTEDVSETSDKGNVGINNDRTNG
jgi:hypothetical protein